MNRFYFLCIVLLSVLCLIFIFFFFWKDHEEMALPAYGKHEATQVIERRAIKPQNTIEPQMVKPQVPEPQLKESQLQVKEVQGKEPQGKEQLAGPSKIPFEAYISGIGIVEAGSGNIFIGTAANRMVSNVPVIVGMEVKKGAVLLELDNNDLKADLQARKADYEQARLKIEKLKSMPRKEDLLSAEAAFKVVQAELFQTQKQYEMLMGLKDSRALSKEQQDNIYFTYQQSQAKEQQAEAELNKIKAGAWPLDLEIAQVEALQAKEAIERAKAEIERTIIRSPIDGTVLQIKIHEGEFPPIDSSKNPMMIIGNISELYLRVSINQHNIPEFNPKAAAVAFLQRNNQNPLPLEFVRVEPYIITKQNISNDIIDIVDTRSLQILYRIQKGDQPLFVGQQMNAFIKQTQD